MNNLPSIYFVETADGSKTLYNTIAGENYHSRNGALQESEHVFINAGLRHFLSDKNVQDVSILEVGFGTGLNFLLSADFCTDTDISLSYTGIEAYPLDQQMIIQTGYDKYIKTDLWNSFAKIYANLTDTKVQLVQNVLLRIAPTRLMDFDATERFDIVYFDAFAVAHQPEMWSDDAIAHTVKFLKPGGIFVTYAITGNLKRQLKSLGFKVEKVPGAAGKREMLRAVLQL